jgi:hypothetical protein
MLALTLTACGRVDDDADRNAVIDDSCRRCCVAIKIWPLVAMAYSWKIDRRRRTNRKTRHRLRPNQRIAIRPVDQTTLKLEPTSTSPTFLTVTTTCAVSPGSTRAGADARQGDVRRL